MIRKFSKSKNGHQLSGLLWRSFVICLICLTLPVGVHASSGSILKLPSDLRRTPKNGIVVEIDSRWVDGAGYRPVIVTVKVRRSKRDRKLNVRLMPNSYSSYNVTSTYSFDITVPGGELEVKKEIYLPQRTVWHSLRAEFFEGNRRLDDISMKDARYGNFQFWNNDDQSSRVLLIDKDVPSIRSDRDTIMNKLRQRARERNGKVRTAMPDVAKLRWIAGQAGNSNFNTLPSSRSGDADSLQQCRQMSTMEMIPPGDLPVSRIGLANIDLMVISLADLQKLAETSPKKFQAVDHHIRSGGNLVLFGDKDDLLSEVKSTLKLSGGTKWRDGDNFDTTVMLAESMGDFSVEDEYIEEEDMLDGMTEPEMPPQRVKRVTIELPEFWTTEHGLGLVTVVSSKDIYDEASQLWHRILDNAGRSRGGIESEKMTWSARHGVSFLGQNPDYWDFLIPGFGAAPVKSFLAVITVFIILIGPINFYFLKRANRIYLLPITVGVAAFITTIAMLAFAIVSDGISTRVRLRSYTKLDQQQQLAQTHCRHSYLAAIAPSEGLVFPISTCVYPLSPFQSHSQKFVEREVEATEERKLTRGFIRSRSTKQFITTSVGPTELGIEVSTDQSGKITAKNKLAVPLKHAWFFDSEGVLFQAGDAAIDAQLTLTSADPKDARIVLSKFKSAHTPSPPKGLDKRSARNMFGQLGINYGYNQVVGNSRQSILEKRITNTNRFFFDKKPNSMLIITESAPAFIATGTEAQQEAGFHIIEGDW